MIKFLPFLPMPVSQVLKVSKPLRFVTESLKKFYPELSVELFQAEIEIEPMDYLRLVIFAAGFMFFIGLSSMLFVLLIIKEFSAQNLTMTFGVAGALMVTAYVYLINYPKFKIMQKVKRSEKHLLFALRHLTIRVKSGIPLIDAIEGIAKGDYGEISKEFMIAIKQIKAGESQARSIEDIALRNPSAELRRVVWQVSNAMRAGSDIAKTLESIVHTLSSKQRVNIKEYGAKLNPLALMYMMATVIIPALGTTMVIILGSFLGLELQKEIFYFVPVYLIIFQVAFMGIVKTNRPAMEV